MPRIAIALLLLAATPLFGATLTWTGAVNSNWSNPGNWSPQVVPQNGDDLVFLAEVANKQVVHDLGDGFVVHNLRLDVGYTLDGNALTITGLFGQSYPSGPSTVNVDITIGGPDFRHGAVGNLSHGSPVLNGALNVNGYTWTGEPYSLTGVILNGPLTGTGSVVMGYGTITSSGDFSGPVRAIELSVDGSLPNATFIRGRLSGTGYIGTIDNDGVWQSFVDPGRANTAGTLHTASLDLTNSTLIVDLFGNGQDIDTVETGSVTIGGAALEVRLPGAPPAPNTQLRIIDNIGAGPVNGTFAGLAEGATIVDGGGEFTISYSGGDGNDVVLTATSTLSTKTVLTTDPPFPTVYSQPVTLIATVTSPSGATVNNGTVTFFIEEWIGQCCGPRTYATVSIVNGVATIAMPAVPMHYAGQYSFFAQYDGGDGFAPSEQSAKILARVDEAPTETTVTASTATGVAGQPVTFTAKVRALPPATAVIPSYGHVVFNIDGTDFAGSYFVDGEASITRTLSEGTHTVVAKFMAVAGAAPFQYAWSTGTLQYTVQPAVGPTLALSGTSVVEGSGGMSNASVTVQLTPSQSQSVTVQYNTVDDTAKAGVDYVATGGTLTFAPGETSKTIQVPIIGEGVPEHDQAFFVTLTSASNATITGGQAAVTIVNDDLTFRTDAYVYANQLELTVDTPLAGSGPFPVILWIPGTTEYAPGDDTPAVRETARGYVVITPEYRPAGTAVFPAQLDDLQTAIRWIRANAARLNIHPDRIAAWGSGTGAYLAALLGTMGDRAPGSDNPAFSHRVQGVVDWSGPSDLARLQSDACSSGSGNAMVATQSLLLGCPLSNCGNAASPLTHVTSDDAPMLLLHGTNDCAVGSAQSQRLHDALRAAGVSATLQLVNAGGPADPYWDSNDAYAAAERFLDGRLKVGRSKRRAVD